MTGSTQTEFKLKEALIMHFGVGQVRCLKPELDTSSRALCSSLTSAPASVMKRGPGYLLTRHKKSDLA